MYSLSTVCNLHFLSVSYRKNIVFLWWCHVSLIFHASWCFALLCLHWKIHSSSPIGFREKKSPVSLARDFEGVSDFFCGYSSFILLVPSRVPCLSSFCKTRLRVSYVFWQPCLLSLGWFKYSNWCAFSQSLRVSLAFCEYLLCIFKSLQSLFSRMCIGSQA